MNLVYFIGETCFKALSDCLTARFIQVMPNGNIPSMKPKWPPRTVVTKTVFLFFSNSEYGKAVRVNKKTSKHMNNMDQIKGNREYSVCQNGIPCTHFQFYAVK